MESSASRTDVIDDDDIRRILLMRETERSIKRRLEALRESIRVTEQDLIQKIESGADVSHCSYGVKIRGTLRRFPAWKEHFISLAGKSAADRVTEETEPKVYKVLVIEVA